MTSRDCSVATRITCGPELIWKSGLAFFEQLKMSQDHKSMALTLNKTDLAFWTFVDGKVLKFEHFYYKRKNMHVRVTRKWASFLWRTELLFFNSHIWIEGENIYLLVWKLFDLIKVNQSNLLWKQVSPFARDANMHAFLYLFFIFLKNKFTVFNRLFLKIVKYRWFKGQHFWSISFEAIKNKTWRFVCFLKNFLGSTFVQILISS